jgi:hypothetical protein
MASMAFSRSMGDAYTLLGLWLLLPLPLLVFVVFSAHTSMSAHIHLNISAGPVQFLVTAQLRAAHAERVMSAGEGMGTYGCVCVVVEEEKTESADARTSTTLPCWPSAVSLATHLKVRSVRR